MFLERLQNLIADKKITKNKMLADLNLGKNSFVNWQNSGTIPNGETLSKIADYFGCSIDYLIGITDFDDETNRCYCEVFSNYF